MALIAVHPGEHLAHELQALDMSAAELARKIDVPTNRNTQILNGTRAVNPYVGLAYKKYGHRLSSPLATLLLCLQLSQFR